MPSIEIMPLAETEREVLGTPAALEYSLIQQDGMVQKAVSVLADKRIERLYLVGSGDSYSAGLAASLAFEHCSGVMVSVEQAYEFAAYGRPGLDNRAAVIVISSSGRPTTTWDALDRALSTPAFVIGITDHAYPGNPFIEKSHLAIVPGASKNGWPAQTTTVTTAILIQLAILLGKQTGYLHPSRANELIHELQISPKKIASVLQDCQSTAREMALALKGQRLYTFVGGGPAYAAACVGAALWAAGPQLPAISHEVEEFHHALRIAALSAGEPLILIAPPGAVDSRIMDTVRIASERGIRLAILGNQENEELQSLAEWFFSIPKTPELINPVFTLPVLQWLSVETARVRVAGGYQRVSAVPIQEKSE